MMLILFFIIILKEISFLNEHIDFLPRFPIKGRLVLLCGDKFIIISAIAITIIKKPSFCQT